MGVEFIQKLLTGLVLDICFSAVHARNALFEIRLTFSESKTFKFTCCLGGFYLLGGFYQIAVNLLRYVIFYSYHTLALRFLNIFKKNFYLFQWKPSKNDENFYFIFRSPFILKIFKFLPWLFSHVQKRLN